VLYDYAADGFNIRAGYALRVEWRFLSKRIRSSRGSRESFASARSPSSAVRRQRHRARPKPLDARATPSALPGMQPACVLEKPRGLLITAQNRSSTADRLTPPLITLLS
jgi:hypothetical protein